MRQLGAICTSASAPSRRSSALSRMGLVPCPLLPDIRLIEHLYENAADNRPGLKTNLFPTYGVIPICKWNTARRGVAKMIGGIKQSAKALRSSSQTRRPRQPIDLGVGGPVIQRKPEFVHVTLIKFEFAPRHFRGKQVQVEQPVPHQVV